MHVLHVIDSLGSLGGAERGFVQEVIRFEQVRSTVVVLSDNVPLLPELEAAGIEVIQLGYPALAPASRMLPAASLRVLSIARRVRPDVIHTSLFHADVAGQFAGLVTRTPVVTSLVSSGDRYRMDAAPGALGRRMVLARGRAWLSGLCRARFRALTAHTARSNAEVLGLDADAMTVIPRGVDLARFSSPEGGDVEHLAGAPAIINVGRHELAKAQWELITAFAAVAKELPDAHLRILGLRGSTTERLHALRRELGLVDRVEFLDPVDNPAALLRGSDLFAFSSQEEGLGSALIEALAVGLPVVAYDIGAVREVTDDGRIADLVPVGDVDALAAAMVRAATRTPDPASAEAQREWIRAHYEAGVVAAAVEDLLVRTARRRTRH